LFRETHRILVAQMGSAALRAAITEPARLVGLVLEEGLVPRMLGDVLGEPGALPLVEDTLDLLWQKRSSCLLTESAYEAVGGVSGALQRRADAVISSLTAAEQRAARSLLVRLVNVAEDVALSTRRRVPLATLRPSSLAARAHFEPALAKLIAARLLVSDGDGKTQAVEVAHEALIRKWPRLQEWVQADRQLLWELAKVEEWYVQWRDYHSLLRGAQLALAQRVSKQAGELLSPDARHMVKVLSLREKRYTALAFLVFGLAVASLLFDALTPFPLPHRLRVGQDFLIVICLFGLFSIATGRLSKRYSRPH